MRVIALLKLIPLTAWDSAFSSAIDAWLVLIRLEKVEFTYSIKDLATLVASWIGWLIDWSNSSSSIWCGVENEDFSWLRSDDELSDTEAFYRVLFFVKLFVSDLRFSMVIKFYFMG